MSAKSISVAGEAIAWSLIEARGPDATAFLQGQLSQDVFGLAPSGGWALLLAPDSVVLTSCWVTVRDDGCDLIVERELVDVALARLSRFLLRSKCVLSTRDVDSGPFSTVAQRVTARWPGAGEFRCGLTPHSFGASFVSATVSFEKGCFTGQELVARLDARGSSVPWRLVRVCGPSEEQVNEVLRSRGPLGPQGVTSVATTTPHFEGLGVGHRTLLDRPATVDSRVEVWPVD
ncbi:MAG: YgfZ family protein [Acidimicrobiales bacterium]